MYEVMARRYRPALFEQVVGQEHIAATLKNAIERDRVAHAYMFTGGHGCGKTTMARILAKALVCLHGPTPSPCCVCPICVDVAAGRDADVLEIDGASNNGIEQIRQLREQTAYVPTRARYKIYIIDEVHMLSDGAFNALLKTLEEPPKHVKFILATTDPHKVPDTILSRCQRFDFRLVPQKTLAEFFRKLAAEEKTEIADEALDAVAAFAEGSVRDGLVLLDQLLSFADGRVERADVEAVRGVASAENVAGIFDAVAARDVRRALAIVDEVASRGTNVGDFLRDCRVRPGKKPCGGACNRGSGGGAAAAGRACGGADAGAAACAVESAGRAGNGCGASCGFGRRDAGGGDSGEACADSCGSGCAGDRACACAFCADCAARTDACACIASAFRARTDACRVRAAARADGCARACAASAFCADSCACVAEGSCC